MIETNQKVHVSEETILIPTYPEPEPEVLPMFVESRNHQGTTGRVYPIPVINDVIRERKIDKKYQAIILENDYIHLIILPELGGRIFGALDKSNNYDFFYRQHVIKPALIGLFGSWISGGAEFNWPIHHRPSTFMPVDSSIEKSEDGAVTVWLSEHEPLHRMKGMVGICLYPEKAIIETKTRLYNRTVTPKTFLWWENIAVPVNKEYQVFFPTDVTYVYYHYKKSVTTYPIAKSVFNGMDLRNGVDIRWYNNTKMNTSFFASRSEYDFFGGYDHGKKAGVIHIANHHISPGKKLFTWGQNQLAQSWEKALTDSDGSYAELMAGVYSDNQPDFSWLEPYETKSFSQYWYPIRELGEPKNANCQAALSYQLSEEQLHIILNVTEKFIKAKIQVTYRDQILVEEVVDLIPGESFALERSLPRGIREEELVFIIKSDHGLEIIKYQPIQCQEKIVPEPSKAVTSPFELKTPDELYLAGVHIKQYRDPIIKPDIYWHEALKKDPDHILSINALGLVCLEKGRFSEAEKYFRKAIAILTKWNPNPRNGEAFYNLGLSLKYLNRLDEAYDVFYKAIWNFRWQSAGYYSLAEIDCHRRDYFKAKDHLKRSLSVNMEHLKARNLLAAVERRLNNCAEALCLVKQNLAIDPLDYWAQNEWFLLTKKEAQETSFLFAQMKSDPAQTCLDIAFDYGNAGLYDEACDLLNRLIKFDGEGCGQYPMLYYSLGYFNKKCGNLEQASKCNKKAAELKMEYTFPVRLEEMIVLQDVLKDEKAEAKAAYYLGNLLYDKEHYEEALKYWELSVNIDPTNYIAFRNLSIAYFNNRNQPIKAIQCLKKSLKLKPGDPQLLFELNQLIKLANETPEESLKLLESHSGVVEKNSNLLLEEVKIYNALLQPEKAIELLNNHKFTPCEGGEQAVAEQHIYAHLMLGRKAMKEQHYREALKYFTNSREIPNNLGAGIWHESILAPSLYYEGVCHSILGQKDKAEEIFLKIANMVIEYFSLIYQPALPYYKAMALKYLNRLEEAEEQLREFLNKCLDGISRKDYGYFSATPFLICYIENPEVVRKKYYNYLIGMAYLGMNENEKAKKAFREVLESERGHLLAKMELSFLTDI
jgi:tetratricopeptide (TPR) repeat protein